jgi:radical SAM superfamily enzyme YgiQ (UPF0313 family)
VLEDIEEASSYIPDTRRVFLADGNALALPMKDLRTILEALRGAFKKLERVGIYANGCDIEGKSAEELAELRELGLGIVYVGLESGDDVVLKRVRKVDSSEEMVQAVLKARKAGIKTSVIVLLGLGGRERSTIHAKKSAQAVSKMNPDYLSVLTVMVVPGTPLYREQEEGLFVLPDQEGLLKELKVFLTACELRECVFRTNHASNYLPLAGVLSRDKERLIGVIDGAMERPEMLRPEYMRGL